MTHKLLGPEFTTLPDAAQATIEGGGGEFIHDVASLLGTAAFYLGQAGIIADNARNGIPIGYASGYGFF